MPTVTQRLAKGMTVAARIMAFGAAGVVPPIKSRGI